MAQQRSFPENVDTERMVLREYSASDAAGLLDLVKDNRERLIREFPQMASLRSLEDVSSFVQQKRVEWESGKTFCYGIWKKQEPAPIGQIQVKNPVWEIPSAELGYFIGKTWQRQGYASESVRGIMRVAFQELEFQRIYVRILPSNHESFALAKKLGFQEEGMQRKAFRCGFGELHDVRYLSMLAQEFLNGRG
jgi:RimJ/RimL family protein N-acetyltransferase